MERMGTERMARSVPWWQLCFTVAASEPLHYVMESRGKPTASILGRISPHLKVSRRPDVANFS